MSITRYSGNDTNLVIPETIDGKTVTEIGNASFYHNILLESVQLPDTVTIIGSNAFAFCYYLHEITLPSHLIQINSGAFADTRLYDIKLPDSLEAIEDYALQGLHIKEFTLPKNMKNYSALAIVDKEETHRLESINVPKENQYFSANNGILYSKDGKTLVHYPSGRPGTSFAIPKSAERIGRCAFANNTYLKEIEIPDSIIAIEEAPFVNLQVTRLDIPSSVKEFGNFPFSNMEYLQTIVMADSGLEELPYGAFHNDKSLKNVTLPTSLVRTGNYAFRDTGLTEIDLSNLTNLKNISLGSFAENKNLKKAILPAGLEVICADAFSYCPNLTDVNLPDSLQEIEGIAFRNSPINETFIAPKGMVCVDENSRHYVRNLQTLGVNAKVNYSDAFKVLELLNEERRKEGLDALTMNQSLLEGAMQRGAEISVFFDHTRPDGSSCFSLSGMMSGENIAAGYGSPESVISGWMNSPGHRSNILSTSSRSVGIGAVVVNGSHYWVQCFSWQETPQAKQPSDTIKDYHFFALRNNAEAQCEREITLKVGESHKIKIIANVTQCLTDIFTYTTNAENITISKDGVIQANAPGVAEITAVNITDATLVNKIRVTVEEVEKKDPAACRVFGFCFYEGKDYWFENGKRQAVEGDPKNIWDTLFGLERGREIYDPESDGWYWLDTVYEGAKAVGKEVWVPYVYQDEDKWTTEEKRKLAYESDSDMGSFVFESIMAKTGKWVRYDENGKMLKGWVKITGELAKIYPDQAGNTYYYDTKTGLMAKGDITIKGKTYHFDKITGVLLQ